MPKSGIESERGWIQRRLIQPLLNLLRGGLTPADLGRSLAAGTVFACFPILGTTTLLCAFAAPLLRLNPVAIQVANYAAYPLQFALLLPFYSAGNRLFGLPPIELSTEALIDTFQKDFWAATRFFAGTGLRGVLVWGILSIPTYWALARIYGIALRSLWDRINKVQTPSDS